MIKTIKRKFKELKTWGVLKAIICIPLALAITLLISHYLTFLGAYSSIWLTILFTIIMLIIYTLLVFKLGEAYDLMFGGRR